MCECHIITSINSQNLPIFLICLRKSRTGQGRVTGYLLSDPKGNIKIAFKFALGKNHGKKSNKEGLTRLGYKITGPNGMDIKQVSVLYATFGHDDFCKMMMMMHSTSVGGDMNEFLQRIVKHCSHKGCNKSIQSNIA